MASFTHAAKVDDDSFVHVPNLLDAIAAIDASPKHFIEAAIYGIELVKREGKSLLRVSGSADADRFRRARLELGKGDAPERWEAVGQPIRKPVRRDTLGEVDARRLRGASLWTLRAVVEHRKRGRREARWMLELGP